ncbi:MAG: AMP-binding protein [Myxococcales bacterium]|nr:AMP-binding protein [Myxococcales bacterium]
MAFLDEATLRAHAGSALVEGGAAVSYGTFAGRAAAVADQLVAAGIEPGDPVGLVSSQRRLDEPVALMGILLAGATAVPLEARAPERRWREILDLAGARAVVVDDATKLVHAAARVELDEEGFVLATVGDPRPPLQPPAPERAMLLHTSGSTGEPKPVPITWEALDVFTAWLGSLVGLGPERRVLRVAELTFDLALFDHLATWRHGATLALLPRRAFSQARALHAAVSEARPHVIYGVPALFQSLVAGGPAPACLDHLCFAGERYPAAALAELVQWAPPAARLFNLYGPTETNVCTFHELDRATWDGGDLPIGRACPYAECRLVAADGEEVIGEGEGELWVTGPTALGGEVATGDRVRCDARRDYHFLGRLDRMVKIAGRRVDPAEVEAKLGTHPGVRAAAVVSADDPRLGRVLVAHVEGDVEASALRRHVRDCLPPHMVPERVVVVEHLPRTAHGKVDYAAL